MGKLCKEVVSDLKPCAYKGFKIAVQFIFFIFFGGFCLTSMIFLVLVLLFAAVERCFVSHIRDFLKNLKSMGDSGDKPVG